jgi:hypothetical protein
MISTRVDVSSEGGEPVVDKCITNRNSYDVAPRWWRAGGLNIAAFLMEAELTECADLLRRLAGAIDAEISMLVRMGRGDVRHELAGWSCCHGESDVDTMTPIPQDMIGGLYYLSTEWRWRRGCDPDAEHREHEGCPKVPV